MNKYGKHGFHVVIIQAAETAVITSASTLPHLSNSSRTPHNTAKFCLVEAVVVFSVCGHQWVRKHLSPFTRE